jgi:hypothetical protein
VQLLNNHSSLKSIVINFIEASVSSFQMPVSLMHRYQAPACSPVYSRAITSCNYFELKLIMHPRCVIGTGVLACI